jgi:metal-responsive CopG/Arc/MetJ family transcriptional regulator
MKTAISLPDELFDQVERLAQRSGRTRSEVYATALREYLARHAPDEVTNTINRLIAELGQPESDGFVAAAAHRAMKNVEW